MLCLHPYPLCWTQPKTCVLACLHWCPMDCICLPHLFIVLSLPPTHRCITQKIDSYICLHTNSLIFVNFVNKMCVSFLGPNRDIRAVCRSCITSQSVWCSPKIIVTPEIRSLLPSGCPVVHQPSAPCQTPTTQGTFQG